MSSESAPGRPDRWGSAVDWGTSRGGLRPRTRPSSSAHGGPPGSRPSSRWLESGGLAWLFAIASFGRHRPGGLPTQRKGLRGARDSPAPEGWGSRFQGRPTSDVPCNREGTGRAVSSRRPAAPDTPPSRAGHPGLTLRGQERHATVGLATVGANAPERLPSWQAPGSPKAAGPVPGSGAWLPLLTGHVDTSSPATHPAPCSPDCEASRETRHPPHPGLSTRKSQCQDAPDRRMPPMLQRTSTLCLAGSGEASERSPSPAALPGVGRFTPPFPLWWAPASLSPRALSSRCEGRTSRPTDTPSP